MKKRQILLSLLAVLFLFFIPIDKQVKIKGSIDFVEPVQKLYISYTNEEGTVSDTAELKNSKFKFEIKANEPVHRHHYQDGLVLFYKAAPNTGHTVPGKQIVLLPQLITYYQINNPFFPYSLIFTGQ